MADIEKNGATPPPFQEPETPITEPAEPITEPAEVIAEPEKPKKASKKKKNTNTLEPELVGGGIHPSKSKEKSLDSKIKKGCLWAVGIFVALVVLAYFFGDDEESSSTPATIESSVTSSTPAAAKSSATSSDTSENAAQAVANSGGHRVTSTADMSIASAGEIPEIPSPMRAVNDYAGLFSASTVAEMEDSLELLSRKTSNQIVVVTVTNLGDYDANSFAVKLGEKWGVGKKGTDNGVVLLIKAKTADSKGQIYIAPGRGLEGVLPDAFCSRLINEEMIPILKKDGNDYTTATWKALNVMMPICRGEYSVEQYDDDAASDSLIELLIYVVIFGFMGFYLYRQFKGGGSGTSYSGRSSSYDSGYGGFGGFGGGSSSGGGFSFGGGSFGGGGAGGSW